MPNIQTYDAPTNLGLQPTETGVTAFEQAGNRIGRFFNQAAAAAKDVGDQLARGVAGAVKDAGDVAVQYAEHQEISHGAAAFAQLNDNLTQAWNDAAKNADPNDPTVAQKFREKVLEPALEKYRDGFLTEGGQKFAEAHVDALRNHMFEKTAADMSSLAKDAVAVNVTKTANSLSNTAMTDPSSVPHLLESASSLVGGMVSSSPNIKGTDAARANIELTEKMKENIVKSGAIGAIQKAADPEAEAQKWGAQYPQYINGAELKMLAANARQQIHARHADATYQRILQNQEAEKRSDAAETGYLQNLYSDDPQQQSKVSATAVVNDPNLTRTSKERMIGIINREFKPETDAKISAASSTALFRKITDPDADPNATRAAIIAARAKDPGTPGSINKADFADLMKNLDDIKTPQGMAVAQDRNEFFKRYAGTIDGYLAQYGIHSALGQQKMYLAEKDAIAQERIIKAKGEDPRSLYDPSSPNFFGRPENIARYHITMQQGLDFANDKGSTNLTGPGKTITGVTVQDAPAFKPPSNWQYSPSRDQYRDPSGKLYDRSGKPVK